MRNFLIAAAIWLVSFVPATADQHTGELSRLMGLVAAYDWPRAVSGARRADAITRDIILWHALRGGHGQFKDYQDFLARRPDWPGLPLLRRVGEAAIPPGADPDAVIGYFTGHLPQTGFGSLRLAEALQSRGAGAIAVDEIRRAWLTLDLSAEELATFLSDHQAALAGLVEARLDRTLWQNRLDQAAALIDLLNDEDAALSRARLALMRGEDGVDAMIAALPSEQAASPGLAYARFVWRLRKGRSDDAVDLLLEQSRKTGGLGDAAAWAGKRLDLARIRLQDGKAQRAYDIASTHGLSTGSDYAALEWLSGYIALQSLNQPDRALEHFRRFRIVVDTPISLSRAGYWEGRALEASGQKDAATHAFEFAAEYSTAFYGQLAAARVGLSPSAVLRVEDDVPEFSDTALAQSSVLKAARDLHSAGETALYRRFLRHLAEAGTPPEQAALGRLALEMGEPYTALYIAKYAADHGNMLLKPYFPVIPVPNDLTVDAALIMAVARRESEFNAQAISHANAHGLMQVMPATARDMATELNLEISNADLIESPELNLRIGSAYLAHLVEDFDGYLPAMLAAYNAGPSRATAWRQIGGYGSKNVDRVVDWVEAVPFAETRNYIMRVSEGYQVYRVLMGGDTEWVLPDLLTGRVRVGAGLD